MNTVKVLYIRKTLLFGLLGGFVLMLVTFSDSTLTAARKGIELFLTIVLPTLFPFFVISEMLYKLGLTSVAEKFLSPVMRPLFNVPGCGAFPLVIGMISGYPVSAAITARMRRDMLLTQAEAERLMAFTNNTSPVFIAGAIAAGIFHRPELSWPLIGCNAAAYLLTGLLFRFYKSGKRHRAPAVGKAAPAKAKTAPVQSHDEKAGALFVEAVKNAIPTVLGVGGFIIFFSVFTEMLSQLNAGSIFGNGSIAGAVFYGSFEITQGVWRAGTAAASFTARLCAAGFLTGWAGFSVHAQIMGMMTGTDISMKPYLAGKLIQGLFLAGIVFVYLSSSRFS